MSFDAHFWADMAAFTTAAIAVIGGVSYFFLRNTKTTNEVVDGPVLVEFRQLLERVVTLELQLKSAINKIEVMEKSEAFLQGEVHAREKRILSLERALIIAQDRIAHLELVCKKAGINGEDLDNLAPSIEDTNVSEQTK